MVEEWRLVDTGYGDAYTNMAVDEAILWARSQGIVPNTLRFFTWRPSAVSIGYFQGVWQEVDVEACRRLGVEIVRRPTGGGAVFHAEDGELTYSVVVPQDAPFLPASFSDSFRVLSQGVVQGLRRLGVDARFAPVNDLVAGGRKISGNAQTRRWGVILQHGTVLVKTDVATVFKVLRVSDEKIRDKAIKAAEERITTVERERGRSVGLEEVKRAVAEGYEEAMRIRLVQGELTKEEVEKAGDLRRRYASREWNFSR